jgi:hypothetical protein
MRKWVRYFRRNRAARLQISTAQAYDGAMTFDLLPVNF